MIIQCPSCNTKFSVETNLVDAVKTPRFHCSRCDHLFKLPSGEEKHNELAAEEEHSSLLEMTDLAYPNTGEQLDLLPSGFDEPPQPSLDQAHVSAQPDTAGFEEDTDFPVVVAWPEDNADSVREVDMSEVHNQELTRSGISLLNRRGFGRSRARQHTGTGTWPAASAVQTSVAAQLEVPTPEEQPLETEEEQVAADQLVEIATACEDDEQYFIPDGISNELPVEIETVNEAVSDETDEGVVIKRETLAEQAPINTAPIYDTPPPEKRNVVVRIDDFEEPPAVATPVIQTRTRQRQMPKLPPMALLSAIPIGLMLMFWAASESVVDSNDVQETLSLIYEPADIIAAPPGVGLVDLESQLITLDDGTEVLEVTGSIHNDTPLTLSEITIEGKLFDAENKLLNKTIVLSNNGLNNAGNVSALREDTIDSLQQTAALGQNPIKQSDKSAFRLIFTQDIAEASWFSARVYSVTPVM